MRTFVLSAVILGIGCLFYAGSLQAALQGTTTRVGTGLSSPLFATFAPGDPNHLFVLEQGGNIRVVDLNSKTTLSTPFLNIGDTDREGEGGLLGLAFHPNYNIPGKTGYGQFYVYVTVDNNGLPVPGGTAATATSPFSTHIRQYSVSANPLIANTTATEIMTWARPQNNHVGGWIGFSPKDGYLYVNSGDGGNGDDVGPGHFEPGGNAQNITDSPNNLLGKQLRIDVNSDAFPGDNTKNYAIPATNPFAGNITGADEIWAYGLRNPYRASFDRDTGDMWIGDVGQGAREEIDVDRYPRAIPGPPGTVATPVNYGWRIREGTNGSGTVPNYVAPVYDYGHGTGTFQGNAVVGGYVYRGPDPSLQGTYFFADETSSHKWSMNSSTYVVTNIDSMLTPNTGSISNPASYAEDAVGNLYLVSYGTGSVFKINTTQLLPGDFNANGTVDAADYALWRKTPTVGDYNVWRANFGNTVHTLVSGAGAAAVPESTAMLLLSQLLLASACLVRPQKSPAQVGLAI